MTTSECCCEQRDSRPGSLSRPVSSAHVPCWPCRARRLEAFDVRSARPSLARMAEQWRAGPSACMSLRTPPAPLPVSRPIPPTSARRSRRQRTASQQARGLWHSWSTNGHRPHPPSAPHVVDHRDYPSSVRVTRRCQVAAADRPDGHACAHVRTVSTEPRCA